MIGTDFRLFQIVDFRLENSKIETHVLTKDWSSRTEWWWSLSYASKSRELFIGGSNGNIVCLGALLEHPVSVSKKEHIILKDVV